MEGLQGFGKSLVVIGGIIVAVGLLLVIAERVNFPFFGKLPGDIYIKRKNFQFYFPIVTSIVLSLVLSLILYVISYFSKR
ncbi:MAG: DUF2905 domain-containing protein [Bacteroidetes bacterium]|nr:DUF2905 domain-containing protein [Bacteroidota bacterium]MCL5739198.1 DUF2905 domain-containing protein [Bacteroidota bacterium]